MSMYLGRRRIAAIGMGALLATLAAADEPKDAGKDKEKAATPAIDKPAPAFDLKGTDGKSYKLDELKDKTVVIEWLNRDCPTCKKLEDKMKATAEEVQKKGALWLAIDSTSYHELKDNAEHVKNAKLPYVVLDDHDGKVGKTYGVKRTPTMFVVHKGTLVYTGCLVPAKDGDRNYVKEAVEAVVAGKEPPVKETQAYG
ncbi:thiol-disulfide oxidoreductase [Phycisphaerae bacterium RAS1]|nr:thiol-disulfide oxidoreductase [Phycisphaerae bacterium RAS1]